MTQYVSQCGQSGHRKNEPDEEEGEQKIEKKVEQQRITFVKVFSIFAVSILNGSAFATSVGQEVWLAGKALYEEKCEIAVPSADCGLLKWNLDLLESKRFQDKANSHQTRFNAKSLFLSYANATDVFLPYEKEDHLPFLACLEEQRELWSLQCQLAGGTKKEFFISALDNPCKFSSTPTLKNVRINLGPDCETLYLELPEPPLGEGSFKTTYRNIEFPSMVEVAYQRYKVEYPKMKQEFRASVDSELEFLNFIKGKTQVGLPKVYHADRERIIIEKFDHSLGIIDEGLYVPKGREFYEISSQLNQSLSYLHESGWIHGDIRPENILLKFPYRHLLTAKPVTQAELEGEKTVRAVYSDFGFTYNIRKLWAETTILPDRAVTGTPLGFAPEHFSANFDFEGRNVTEIEANAQRTEVFQHSLLLFRMKNATELPWFSPECQVSFSVFKACYISLISDFQKNALKSNDPVNRVLAKGFSVKNEGRPSLKKLSAQLNHIVQNLDQVTQKLKTSGKDFRKTQLSEILSKFRLKTSSTKD